MRRWFSPSRNEPTAAADASEAARQCAGRAARLDNGVIVAKRKPSYVCTRLRVKGQPKGGAAMSPVSLPPVDSTPRITDMPEDRQAQVAALVALLRQPGARWTEIAAEVLAEGSALAVLYRHLGAGRPCLLKTRREMR